MNAEARHSVALEMRILFSTTPCFSLDEKTSKPFRTEIHLVCNPDAGLLFVTSGHVRALPLSAPKA